MKNYVSLILFVRWVILLFLISTLTCFSSFKKNDSISSDSKQTVDSILKELPEIDLDYISGIQGVKHQIPLMNYFFENCDEIPHFSESICNSIVGSQLNFQTLFHYSFQMLSASAGGFGPPLMGTGQSKTISSQDELNRFFEIPGVELIQKQEWEKLPFLFRKGIVELLYSIDEAKMVFEQFSKPIKQYLSEKSAFSNKEIYDELIVPWDQQELTELSSLDLIKYTDLKKLSFATRKLTEKLNWFFMQKEVQIPEDFKACSIISCMGELLISGAKNDTIRGDQFFVVELGGDDIYLGNTASSLSRDQPIGIVVDLEGNDKYLCDDNFLVAGILGIAVLLDLDGDDKYNCQSNSQAFGGTLGVGIFYDNKGNDHYNTTSIAETENYSSQSFVQGAAKGRWAEATDGQSLAGGIGIFIDNSGIDKYAAESFSQGASYYFGLGLFNDDEGDDEYNAISHSQGYAAHYSLAGFFEQKGDDAYNTRSDKDKITQIIGGVRDFSVGLFMEYDGDDTYHFGNRSAGIADINGIGMLADLTGDDKYIWFKNSVNSGSQSLGNEPGLGESMNLGFKIFQSKEVVHKAIFIDLNGINSFE